MRQSLCSAAESVGCHLGILPTGGEQACFHESVEGFVEGAVGGEEPRRITSLHLAGDGVAVELGISTAFEGGAEDGEFHGQQGAGFSSHGMCYRKICSFRQR